MSEDIEVTESDRKWAESTGQTPLDVAKDRDFNRRLFEAAKAKGNGEVDVFLPPSLYVWCFARGISGTAIHTATGFVLTRVCPEGVDTTHPDFVYLESVGGLLGYCVNASDDKALNGAGAKELLASTVQRMAAHLGVDA